MLRFVGSSIDGCIAAGAEATKACVREIFRHCSQLTGAVSAFTLDLVHSRGYYAGQASRFSGRPPRQDSPPPPSASTFRAVNKTSSGKKSRYYVRLLRKLLALFWSFVHVLFSLFLPRAIFGRILGNTGRVTAGDRLRRAPSELNFQSPSPASTGFLEDACVHILSFIDRSGAFLRRPVRYIFGLNLNNNAHPATSVIASTALGNAAVAAKAAAKLDTTLPPPHPPQDVLLNSDVSARFGLSVSSIVSKAGCVLFAMFFFSVPFSSQFPCRYPYRRYDVVTDDGYILCIDRIARPSSARAMLLVHGIMDSSHAWVAGGAASGLGFRYVAIAAAISATLQRPFSRIFFVTSMVSTRPLV